MGVTVDWEAVNGVAGLASAVAVLATLWLLSRQMKEMAAQTKNLSGSLHLSAESLKVAAQSLRLGAEAALDTIFMTVTQAYLSHPQLRPVFNEQEHPAQAELSSEDRLRANALAESLADSMERSIRLSEEGFIGTELRVWIEDSFRHSAFFRQWLDQHRNWYCDELVSMRDRVDQEVRQSGHTQAEAPDD